jgi:hypothetical protein
VNALTFVLFSCSFRRAKWSHSRRLIKRSRKWLVARAAHHARRARAHAASTRRARLALDQWVVANKWVASKISLCTFSSVCGSGSMHACMHWLLFSSPAAFAELNGATQDVWWKDRGNGWLPELPIMPIVPVHVHPSSVVPTQLPLKPVTTRIKFVWVWNWSFKKTSNLSLSLSLSPHAASLDTEEGSRATNTRTSTTPGTKSWP